MSQKLTLLLPLVSLFGVGFMIYLMNQWIVSLIPSSRGRMKPFVYAARISAGLLLTLLLLVAAGVIGEFLMNLAASTGLVNRDPVPACGYCGSHGSQDIVLRVLVTVLGAVTAYTLKRKSRAV
jgi:hypothetical protein